MFCRYCGNKIADDAKFCPVCGQPVKMTAKASTPVSDNAQAQPAAPTAAPHPTCAA